MSLHKPLFSACLILLVVLLAVPVSAWNWSDGFESSIERGIINGSSPFYSNADTWGSVYKEGSTYYNFVSTPTRIAVHNSSDGVTWGERITLLEPDVEWEGWRIYCPMVWKEGSTYYMIYSGIGDDGYDRVGLATSNSPESGWTKYAGNPVYVNTNWSVGGAEAWGIQKIGSVYYMWVNNFGGYGPAGTNERQIGLITSTDLIHWTEDPNNPIYIGQRFCPWMFKYNGMYYMLVGHRYEVADYPEIELYKSYVPTFYPSQRTYMGIVLATHRNLTSLDGVDLDTPTLVSSDIAFDYTDTDPMEIYYGTGNGTWNMGLFSLSKAALTDDRKLFPDTYSVFNDKTTVFSLSTEAKMNGSQSLKIDNSSSSVVYRVAVNEPAGNISLWFNHTASGEFDVYGYSGVNATNLIYFKVNTARKPVWKDGDTTVTGSYTGVVNTWYNLNIYFNTTQGKWALTYRTLASIKESTPLINMSGFLTSPELSNIQLIRKSGTSNVMYIDDLIINGTATNDINDSIPVASFTTNVTSGTVPLAVAFTDTSTNSPTGWNWSFGDGNWSNGTANTATHLYESAGTFDAFLIASNGGGSSTSATTAITVNAAPVSLQCQNQTGNITINLFSNSTTSLGWNWQDPGNITQIAEDGLFVTNFDNSSDYFIGTGYLPESWHKLKIYNQTDYGQLNCTTDAVPVIPTPIPMMPSTESTAGTFNPVQYWWIGAGALGIILLFKKW